MDFSQYLGGLPLHPLVVHFAVVLVPLAALGLILLVVFRGWADKYGWLALLVLAAGTGATFVARASGEDLAAQVGRPAQHASLGTVLPWVSAALFVVALVWLLLHKGDRRADRKRSPGTVVTGIITVVLAIGTTVLTVLVGHSGAEAAWGGRVDAPSASAPVTPAPTPSPSASATSASASASSSASASETSSASASPSADATYTMADVEKHNSSASCWAAIDGSVYNLTSWISQHPGGADKIVALCGTDATKAFEAQHAGQAEPEQELKELKIGTLS